jgi:hypothetical protein
MNLPQSAALNPGTPIWATTVVVEYNKSGLGFGCAQCCANCWKRQDIHRPRWSMRLLMWPHWQRQPASFSPALVRVPGLDRSAHPARKSVQLHRVRQRPGIAARVEVRGRRPAYETPPGLLSSPEEITRHVLSEALEENTHVGKRAR